MDLRFQVLTAVSMKMTVFWDVGIRAIALMMETSSTSKTSVNFYQSRRNIPEDSLHLYGFIFSSSLSTHASYHNPL
jgi:hypothetical protein